MAVLRQFLFAESGDAQHIEDEHAVVGDNRAAALRDDRRVLHPGVVAHRLDVKHDVVGVFLERVVDARFEIRLRAIVVDAQPAADVDVFEPRAFLGQLGIDARRLIERALHDADVRDLAAQMKVQELEAVLHAERLELFEPLPHLGDGQTELGAIAAGRLPPAAAARRQLDAHADVRPDADLPRILEHQAELGVFLDHRDDPPAHLLRQHRHLDVFGVLEAVADDRRLVGRHRDDGQELGLGPGFKAEVVGPAEVEHFFDHLPLLVDLDGIDAEVLPVVRVLADRRLERAVDVGQPLAEDVAKANENRQANPAQLQVVNELLQVDPALGILGRVDADVAVRSDGKVVLAPALDLIELAGVGDCPRFALTPWP